MDDNARSGASGRIPLPGGGRLRILKTTLSLGKAAMAEEGARKGRRGRRRSNPLERYAADILAKQLFLEDLAVAAVDFEALAADYPELTPEQLRGRLGIATKRALLEDVADIVLEPADNFHENTEQMRLAIVDPERFAQIVHEEMMVEVM